MRWSTWGLWPRSVLRPSVWILRAHPDLRKLFWSNAFWTFGAGLYTFVWPNHVRDLGGDAGAIGYLTALMYGTMALTLLPGGWLADRRERRGIMLVTWGLASLAPLAFALAPTWPALVPGVLLYGMFLGWPAMEAYIADSVPPEALGRAFAVTNSGYALGAVPSPLLGAALLPAVGMRGLFISAFFLFALSTLLIATMRPQRPRAQPDPSPRRGTGRPLPLLIGVLVVASAASAGIRTFVPPFLEDVRAFPRPWILAAGSLLALGEFALAWPLGHWADRDRGRALAGGLALGAAGAGLLLLPGGIVPGLLLLGSDRVVYSLLRAEIGTQVTARRGVAFGLTGVLATVGQAVGPLGAAWAYGATPSGPLLLALGTGVALAWATAGRVLRKKA